MTAEVGTLSPAVEKFVLHWGEMGTRWGVNRTIAQIHALLYVSPKPLTAEQIAGTLSVARSNVSNSLRELQSWRLIKVVHVMGDRRDHFGTYEDVWDLFKIVLEERKRREVDPTRAMLQDCVAEMKKAGASDAYAKGKLEGMLEFFELGDAWFKEIIALSAGTLRKLVRLGGKVQRLLGAE